MQRLNNLKINLENEVPDLCHHFSLSKEKVRHPPPLNFASLTYTDLNLGHKMVILLQLVRLIHLFVYLVCKSF